MGPHDQKSLETSSLWEDAPHFPGQLSGALSHLSSFVSHAFPFIFCSSGQSGSLTQLQVSEYAMLWHPWGPLSLLFFSTLEFLFLCLVNLYFTFVNSFLYLMDNVDLSFQGPYHLLFISLLELLGVYRPYVFWAAWGQRLFPIHLDINACRSEWKDQMKVIFMDN